MHLFTNMDEIRVHVLINWQLECSAECRLKLFHLYYNLMGENKGRSVVEYIKVEKGHFKWLIDLNALSETKMESGSLLWSKQKIYHQYLTSQKGSREIFSLHWNDHVEVMIAQDNSIQGISQGQIEICHQSRSQVMTFLLHDKYS